VSVSDFTAPLHGKAHRCVRIVHGKGLGSPHREPVLKGKLRPNGCRCATRCSPSPGTAAQGGAGRGAGPAQERALDRGLVGLAECGCAPRGSTEVTKILPSPILPVARRLTIRVDRRSRAGSSGHHHLDFSPGGNRHVLGARYSWCDLLPAESLHLVTVSPVTPTSESASRTSSSLNGSRWLRSLHPVLRGNDDCIAPGRRP